jgi:predicted acylesterase/phospholipase RssA
VTTTKASSPAPWWREALCDVIVGLLLVLKLAGVLLFGIVTAVKRVARLVTPAASTRTVSESGGSELDSLRSELWNARSFEEWHDVATRIDELTRASEWRKSVDLDDVAGDTEALFNARLIATRLARLTALRAQTQRTNDPTELVTELRTGLLRHLAGIGSDALYNVALSGTKHLIVEYVDAVCEQLRFVSSGRFGAHLDAKAKYAFLHETRQAFGRTALMLSGGASLGLYHVGVILTLRKLHLLPKVVCGSSVGAMIGAMLCCKPDAELDNLLQPGAINFDVFEDLHGPRIRPRIMRLLERGYLMDIGKLRTFLRTNLGDVTFAEAFVMTGRVFNVSVLSTQNEPAFLLNYLTAPSVLVWSAACASCALPGLFEPVELMAKRDGKIEPYHPSTMQWSDGSMEHDLPMERVAELFNVNHFVVSQVNPHVVPFVSDNVQRGHTRASSSWWTRTRDAAKFLMWSEVRHRVTQFAHLFPGRGRAVSKFVTQPYFGDINIVPHVSIADFEQLLKNPSFERLLYCVRQGERAVFPRIAQIRDNLAIERVLDEAVFAASMELAKAGDNSGLQQLQQLHMPLTALDRSAISMTQQMLRSPSKESFLWK